MSFMTFTLDGRRDADRWEESRLQGLTRKRFWCRDANRDVEVVFLTRGLPGFRRISGVKSCTAFDPRADVTCTRKCVDADCRRMWELPISILIQKL